MRRRRWFALLALFAALAPAFGDVAASGHLYAQFPETGGKVPAASARADDAGPDAVAGCRHSVRRGGQGQDEVSPFHEQAV
jgi:hypothetical protein